MNVKSRSTTLDARIILLGFGLNVLAFPLFYQTSEILCLLGLSAAALLAEKHFRRAVLLFVQFLVFYLLAFSGAQIIMGNPASLFGMELSMVGVMGQRVIPVLGYVYILSHISSGEFMSVLMGIKLPKSAAIGITSLFRFIPALGQTFTAMRRASLFRGEGFRGKSILLHPARSVQYYLLPFLSRLSRISDDLAAALATRGVGMDGMATSVRDLRAKGRDYAAFAVLLCFYGALLRWRYLL